MPIIEEKEEKIREEDRKKINDKINETAKKHKANIVKEIHEAIERAKEAFNNKEGIEDTLETEKAQKEAREFRMRRVVEIELNTFFDEYRQALKNSFARENFFTDESIEIEEEIDNRIKRHIQNIKNRLYEPFIIRIIDSINTKKEIVNVENLVDDTILSEGEITVKKNVSDFKKEFSKQTGLSGTVIESLSHEWKAALARKRYNHPTVELSKLEEELYGELYKNGKDVRSAVSSTWYHNTLRKSKEKELKKDLSEEKRRIIEEEIAYHENIIKINEVILDQDSFLPAMKNFYEDSYFNVIDGKSFGGESFNTIYTKKYEIDPKLSLTSDVKLFFMSIPRTLETIDGVDKEIIVSDVLDKETERKTYYSFDYIYDTFSDIIGDMNVFEEEEAYKKAKSYETEHQWLKEILSDKELFFRILYQMQGSITGNIAIRQVNGKWAVVDIARIGSVDTIYTTWKESFVSHSNELIQIVDEQVTINKDVAKKLIEQFEKFKENVSLTGFYNVKNGKTFEPNRREITRRKNQIIKWLSHFGITIDLNTLNYIEENGGIYIGTHFEKERKIDKKTYTVSDERVNLEGLFNTSEKSKGLLGNLYSWLVKEVAKQKRDNKATPIPNNPFYRLRYKILSFASVYSKFNEKSSSSYPDGAGGHNSKNKLNSHGANVLKEINNLLSIPEAKKRKEAIEEYKKNNPEESESSLLKILFHTNNKFFNLKKVITAIDILKNEKQKNKLDEITEIDAELVRIMYFANNFRPASNVNTKIKMRMGQLPFLTTAGKGTTHYMERPVYLITGDYSIEKEKKAEGNIVIKAGNDIFDLMYEQLVVPDLKRIHRVYSGEGKKIKNYNVEGKKLQYLKHTLRDIEVKTILGNKPYTIESYMQRIHALMKTPEGKKEIYGYFGENTNKDNLEEKLLKK